MAELAYFLSLSKVPLIGPVLARTLIAYCGSAKGVFETPLSKLTKIPGVGLIIARNISGYNNFDRDQLEIEYIQKNEIQVLHYLSDEFPSRLKHYEDAPILLFVKGNVNLNTDKIVSIVGTRDPSAYGTMMCEKIIEGLKNYNPLIISGLAYGVDTIAHRKAMEAELQTIGVLGHGFKHLYPAQNTRMAIKMQKNGGLLTEFSFMTKPDKENFPKRNRIIASLSDAIVVIESGIRGGSVITAEYGNAYNKDVFAVPGRVTDSKSAGTNSLIKRHKAQIVESAKDLAYIMRWEESQTDRPKQTSIFPDLSDEAKLIYKSIAEAEDIHLDRLHQKSDLPLSKLSQYLLELEMKGLVKCLPGKRYTPVV